MIRKLILITFIATLAACNTVAGVGEDISGTANAVKNRF